MKIMTILGARPQFIKASAVSVELARLGAEDLIVHTGQHYDPEMSQVFFEELGLPKPLVNLEIGSGPHGEQTGRMLGAIEATIKKHAPDAVLVYGDTNSTLAGALAAVKLHVPVAHVEAGLRSFNRRMPEEINRIVADAVSDLLFVPTATAADNLAREGVSGDKVILVGDVMYDVALRFGPLADERSTILATAGVSAGGYILATIHRAENTDHPERLLSIVNGLRRAAADMPVVWPMHPRTRGALAAAGLWSAVEAELKILPPVGYLDMIKLQKDAALVATDSGGVQKEAFFQGVPCVTLRDETEWVELVELGWNRLCPPVSAEAIAEAIRAALGRPGVAASPYGDGRAAGKIADTLLRAYGRG